MSIEQTFLAPPTLLLDGSDPLQTIAYRAQETVEAVGRRFRRRNDDWAPMLSGLDVSGKLHALDIDGQYLASEASKDMFADLLPGQIRELRLTTIAFVTSSWVLLDPSIPPHELLTIPPSQHPKRTEAVMVHAMDSARSRCLLARIHRMGRRPPRLGEWRELSDTGHGPNFITGRFVEPLRTALLPAAD